MKLSDYIFLQDNHTITSNQGRELAQDIANKTIEEIDKIIPANIKIRLEVLLSQILMVESFDELIEKKLDDVLDWIRRTS